MYLHFALNVKCQDGRLLAFQRFYWTLKIAQVERRTVFMKQMSSEIRRGLTVINSRQFKTRMMKMAAQVNFCLLLNAFLSCLQFGA